MLTRNFKISEFDCRDGTPVPEQYKNNAREVAENLQIIRDYVNVRYKERGEIIIKITSAFRTPSHNKKVGGAKNSQHLKAKAADIYAPKLSTIELYKLILKLINLGKIDIKGLGIYEDFIHCDTRKNVARW